MRRLLFTGVLALGACAATPEWESVSVDSFGKGGSAHKTVNADGSMSGGHLSGDNPPRFFRNTGTMSAEDLEKVNALLAELPPPHTTPRPQAGYTMVVKLKDGKQWQYVSVDGPSTFPEPKVWALYKLVGTQSVGGW